MYHVLIAILLALTLFTSSLPSSASNFFEERVSLCAEAIESVQHSNNQNQQTQLDLLRVHVIDATLIELPSTSTTPFTPTIIMQAAFDAERAATAAKRKHRSRLISEMARDVTRNSDSIASSTGSCHGTVSPDSTQTTDFNPEKDEALMSTLPLNPDFSQNLPQIRDTAKKCGRWAPRPQQSYVINTSALARAFPDFTGGASTDSELSLEIGRGGISRPNNKNNNNVIYADNSNNEKSSVIDFNNPQILYTPRNPHATTSDKPYLQDASRNNIKRNASNLIDPFNADKKESTFNRPLSTPYSYNSASENHSQNQQPKQKYFTTSDSYSFAKENDSQNQRQQQKHVSTSDTFTIDQKENIPPKSDKVSSPYTSNASRLINGKRRTLHARVADESDIMDSTLSSTRSNVNRQEAQAPFRPETSIDSSRPTRSKMQHQEASAPLRAETSLNPARPTTSKTQHRNTPTSTPLQLSSSRSRANSQKLQTKSNTAKILTPNPTQASFVAPPVPASSEQGSATFDIGVPVSVQNGRVQPRNASSRYRRNGIHERVDAFDLPDEEEDIYFMCDRQKLQITRLEEQLEARRAEFDHRIKELETENARMKHEQAQLKMEKKHWDSHQCVDKDLETEVALLRIQRKGWEQHQCVDEEMEMENAQLIYDNAQFKKLKKSWDTHNCVDKGLERDIAQLKIEKEAWDTHKCVDKGLEREIAQLKIDREAWEAHKCRDDDLEAENAQLKNEVRAWESHKCVDRRLQREVAQLKIEKRQVLEAHKRKDKDFQDEIAQLMIEMKEWDAHKCRDRETQEEISQLKTEMKAWESQQSLTRDLKAENAQLKLEKKSWESHRCLDSGLGDSGSERGSTRYKQLKIEKTRLEEKFTTLTTRYESLEKQYHQTQRSQKKSRNDDDMTSAFIIPDIISDVGDEPTLRPVMGPVEALAKALRNKRNEISDLKKRLARLHDKYNGYEGSVGKRHRLSLEQDIKGLVDIISGKSEELYLLHDVELGQEDELPWEGIQEV